jgi:PAS domain S-box-containing protein
MSDLVIHENALTRAPEQRRASSRVGLLIRCLILCIAYYLGTTLGYLLIFPGSYISVMWPPNTFLFVALLLSPLRYWPWLLLAAYPVHLLAESQHGVGLTQATLYYGFDCVLVPLTAAGLRHFGLERVTLADFRQALLFIAVITASAALASFVWSPLIVWLFMDGDVWVQWGLVLLSNVLPFLVATPCIVIALTRGRQILRTTSSRQVVEFALLIVGLLICGVAVFGLQARLAGHPAALGYAPLPFLLWAAVRFGPGGLSFSFLVFSVIATFYTLEGHGPLVASSPGDVVLWLQIFLLALYVPLLVLASLVEERRAKGAALTTSEARYRSIVEDQTELICRFLPDGTYTFVNGAYCRYFQRTPEELLGKTFWSFIPRQGHATAKAYLAGITPERPVSTTEHEVVAPGGEIRWQQWRDRGFFDAQGRIVDYQAVGRDITERKRAELALQNLSHAARLAVVGELTGSIAHEINQPLGAILSNAEAAEILLETDAPPIGEVRNILADIRRDDLRASEVIRRVRGLLSKREPLMVPLDINDVAEEVLQLVSADARQRKIELTPQFGHELPCVQGDRVRVQQVLLNLIMNGLESMHDTPEDNRRLVVRTGPDEQAGARICVTDCGHGIPADRLSSIFESFVTTKEHGMGLGLSIARSIVSMHGGRIWASNNAHGGATFTFTLPATQTAQATHDPRGAS